MAGAVLFNTFLNDALSVYVYADDLKILTCLEAVQQYLDGGSVNKT